MPEDTIQAQIPAVSVDPSSEVAPLFSQPTEAVAEATHQVLVVPDELAEVLQPTEQPTLSEVAQVEPLAQVPVVLKDVSGDKITYPGWISNIDEARRAKAQGKPDDADPYVATIILRGEDRIAA